MLRQVILLTGATGYTGRHVCQRLARDGHVVHALVRRQTDLPGVASQHFYDGTEQGALALLERSSPDTVIHIAAAMSAGAKPDGVERIVDANIRLPLHLLEGMARTGCKRFVNTSSFWQTLSGDTAYRPVNLYAASKQALLDLLAYYTDGAGVRAIDLTMFDIYGPDDPRGKLLSVLQNVALGDKRLAMSPGEQEIGLVHVEDVAAAFSVALDRLADDQAPAFERFGVSPGETVTLRELVGRIERLVQRALPIDWGGRPYRKREVMRLWSPPRLPGWHPVVTLDQGLAELFGEAATAQPVPA